MDDPVLQFLIQFSHDQHFGGSFLLLAIDRGGKLQQTQRTKLCASFSELNLTVLANQQINVKIPLSRR